MTCDCDLPRGRRCRQICGLGELVIVVIQTGGTSEEGHSEAIEVVNQLYESSFDESLDMTLITEAAEKLHHLGEYDAALIMSSAVTSAATYANARFEDAPQLSEAFLVRNYALQAQILDDKGAHEAAAEFRRKFVYGESKAAE